MNFGGQKAYTAPRADRFGKPSLKLHAVGLIMCDTHSRRVRHMCGYALWRRPGPNACRG
jgi:hypothetical protein